MGERCARARSGEPRSMFSRIMGLIARAWIAEGFSKPARTQWQHSHLALGAHCGHGRCEEEGTRRCTVGVDAFEQIILEPHRLKARIHLHRSGRAVKAGGLAAADDAHRAGNNRAPSARANKHGPRSGARARRGAAGGELRATARGRCTIILGGTTRTKPRAGPRCPAPRFGRRACALPCARICARPTRALATKPGAGRGPRHTHQQQRPRRSCWSGTRPSPPRAAYPRPRPPCLLLAASD